jgi:hypothetical protein
VNYRLAVIVGASVFGAATGMSAGMADGIEPGLWRITAQSESNGMAGPPHESSKCLTADETRDLAATFSPIPRTINSDCAPIERTLDGTKLSWHLVCRGQLNVDLTGAFSFDSPASLQRDGAHAGGHWRADHGNARYA